MKREVALVLAHPWQQILLIWRPVRQPPYETLAPIALSSLPATMASDHGCEGGNDLALDSQSRDGSQMANREPLTSPVGGAQPEAYRRSEATHKEQTGGVGLGSSAATALSGQVAVPGGSGRDGGDTGV
nr:hypothetical protein Iba_chr02bCG10710 [Ipomoea batatas]GME19383.1 hypothetical protein Iba_scaffold22724CG0010 [Ipomoea batatas]